MGRPSERGPFVFHQDRAQKMWWRILHQAQLDCFSHNRKVRTKALSFLFGDGSDWAIMALGIADTDSFREQLREHMYAEVVRISFPGCPTFEVAGKKFWKMVEQQEQERWKKQRRAFELRKAA